VILLAAIQLLSYVLLLVLAGYLLTRSRAHALSLTAAGVLLCFALIQADQLLGGLYPGQAAWIGRALWIAYPLPAALWLRAAILLWPGEALALDRAWWTLVLPCGVLLILGGWVGSDLVDFATRDPGPLYWTFGAYGVLVSLLTAGLFYLLLRQAPPGDPARRVFIWLLLAGLGYAAVMVILALGLLPPDVLFAAVIVDVVIFGAVGIAYDALAEGHAVLRDLAAGLLKTLLVASLLVLPWAISLAAADSWTFAATVALLFTLGVAIMGVALQDMLDHLLDRLLWRGSGEKPSARAALRTLLRDIAREPEAFPAVTALDRDEFTRLTRRALSHLPNLPQLAASPLTTMQIVTQRAGGDADALRRAGTLRGILIDCIDALRPPDRGAFGTTEEWRFYNALYYPYVAGISPYRHHALAQGSGEDGTREVVRWFQAEVPQRTMYNWQNCAAERIAAILLERESRQTSQSADHPDRTSRRLVRE
jgi:hypothetical protein